MLINHILLRLTWRSLGVKNLFRLAMTFKSYEIRISNWIPKRDQCCEKGVTLNRVPFFEPESKNAYKVGDLPTFDAPNQITISRGEKTK